MARVRFPLIILLSLIFDLVAPVGMSLAETSDMFQEEAIHRPHRLSAIVLERRRSLTRDKVKPQTPHTQLRLTVRPPIQVVNTGRESLKTPQPVSDSPQSPEDH